jgi:hypothetical protein
MEMHDGIELNLEHYGCYCQIKTSVSILEVSFSSSSKCEYCPCVLVSILKLFFIIRVDSGRNRTAPVRLTGGDPALRGSGDTR